MKRKVVAIVMLLAFLCLSACGKDSKESGNNQDTGVQVGKELAVQIGPDPETIDPALNSAVDGGNMILHAYECLLVVNQEGKLAPGQAESWEVSKDGLIWTFHLREGLKWSDGTDLTANDFVYSWRRVCDPNVAAPYAETVLGMVKGYDEAITGQTECLGVSAPDAKTLVVELAKPCTYFGSLAAFATLSPVQQATIEKNGDKWAVTPEAYISNGPFYMEEWVPGSHITFAKNPYYWNKDAVKLGKLKFVLMEDSNAAYSAYQTGQVLLVKDVPTEEIPKLTGSDEFFIDPIIGTYYVSLNNKLDTFKDVRVRKALSLAIDRNYLANTIMQGTYSPAGNLVGPGWMDTDETAFVEHSNGGKEFIDISNFANNLEEAKKLMEEAGYKNGKGFPKITYSTNDTAYHKVVAEYLQQAWGELGIQVEVNIVEWSSFTPMRRSGDYITARNGWVGDYDDPSNILDLFCTKNGNNDGKYSNEEYDKVMETARTTLDAKERSEALHKAEEILIEDMGCIPLAYYNDFWLQSKKITGSWHSAYGYWHFMYADVTEG